MSTSFKKTMMAALVAGVALGAALPALAQQGTPPAPPAMGNAMPPMMGQMPAFDFKSFDTDGDGKVTLAEIQAKRGAETASVDADGDGKLSAEELVAARLAQAKTRIEAGVKARIAAQDADGDGKLSAAEMAAPPAPVKLFEMLDANKDGALSEEELAAGQARMMQRMGERGDRDDRGERGGWDDRDDRGGWGDRDDRGPRGGERGERGERGHGGPGSHRWFDFGGN